MLRFPKNQRLCNNTDIDILFDEGTSISLNSFRIVWSYNEKKDDVLMKSIIIVPKKKNQISCTKKYN